MKYGNPLPPEGINTSPTHPLKEMLLLTGGLIAIIVAVVIIVGALAERFAHYIPFETEVELSSSMPAIMHEQSGEVQVWLQLLADKLAAAQKLPEEMHVTVHYVDNGTVNAMASLGGHVVMFRGLLEKLESENAVAMVLAHEIAHVHHRHPIQTLGRGAVVSLALATIGIAVDDAANILGSTGLLTELTFSRHQEQQSDDTALLSLFNHYGHINGATDLFEVLLKEEPEHMPKLTFLSTHPLSENRIERIREYARQQDWPLAGELTAIPRHVRQQLAVAEEKPA